MTHRHNIEKNQPDTKECILYGFIEEEAKPIYTDRGQIVGTFRGVGLGKGQERSLQEGTLEIHLILRLEMVVT